ncbi:hypothetical protein MRB53_040902 [Persea americana]|nr:hypothetical protein MRB53_040902 [Persea americana]
MISRLPGLICLFSTLLILLGTAVFYADFGLAPDVVRVIEEASSPYTAQIDLNNIQFSVGPPGTQLQAKMRRNGLDIRKVATTLEMTDRPQALPVLLHFLHMLGPEWTFRIYHNEAIAKRLDSIHLQPYLDSGKLTLIPVNIVFPSHTSVSDFFGGRTYWDALAPSEHIFMFQFDSVICANANKTIEDFLEYDFIGAPVTKRFWERFTDAFVMNGGFSLRRRSSLLRIIDEFGPLRDQRNEKYMHEDQFFSDMLRKHGGKIPSIEVARNFSVETVFGSTPFGIHKAARYLKEGEPEANPEGLRLLETQWCPEMNMITSIIE